MLIQRASGDQGKLGAPACWQDDDVHLQSAEVQAKSTEPTTQRCRRRLCSVLERRFFWEQATNLQGPLSCKLCTAQTHVRHVDCFTGVGPPATHSSTPRRLVKVGGLRDSGLAAVGVGLSTTMPVGPAGRRTRAVGQIQAVRLRPELPRAGRLQTGRRPGDPDKCHKRHGPRRLSAEAECRRCRTHMVAPFLGAH